MSDRRQSHEARVCPKTGKPIHPQRRWPRWVIWLLPLAGLASAIWFLIRVAPKPSRAAYPCQRLAAPMASSFVVWVTGIIASAVAFKRAKDMLHRSRYVVAIMAVLVGIGGVYFAAINTPLEMSDAATETRWYPQDYVKPINQPMGVPQGIHPGRVVWLRDPDATDWNGTTGVWRDAGNTDPVVVDQMVSDALRWLTGETSDAAAWDALFRYRNRLLGKGDVGYDVAANEKIAIKLNLVATPIDAAGFQNDHMEYANHSIEMVHSLLDQLVNVAGVPQDLIYIGDPTNSVSGQFMAYLTPDFPDVHYMSKVPLAGRDTVQFSSEGMYWSTPDAAGKTQDYWTQYYANAEYFINFAILKAHWAGITQCGKNHYGSMTRRPDATGDGYYAMHDSLSYMEPNYSSYRTLVDLLGHEITGGRNLLYMMDGLWSGYGWGGATPPVKWLSPPFNNDWPSSVLMSQDPMAIDSVGFDLWWEEDKANWTFYQSGGLASKRNFPHIIGSCDYLQEGAKADNPDSGTFYDPENDGVRMQSLGVHEHHDGQFGYTAIDLVRSSPLPAIDVAGRHIFYNNSVYDGNDPAANAADDAAIAPDKTPLFAGPGVTATFANYTGYDLGINGIMVDITNMPGAPTAADFECRVGDGTTWSTGPAPSVSVRAGAGDGGSDRVTLIFPDGAVRDTWLEVTVLATADTGLASDDTFYVGNAPGDSGDSPTDAEVTAADVDSAADNPQNMTLDEFVVLKQNFGQSGVGWAGGDYNRDGEVSLDDFVILKQCFAIAATIDDPNDHDRDGCVKASDLVICEGNQTTAATCLPLLSWPEPPGEIVLIEAGADWKYLDDGSDMGTAWRAPLFPDGGWDSGPAVLGYGSLGPSGLAADTVVEYGPDSENKYVTTYFRHTFHLDDVSAITELTVEVIRDDAAAIYLNGSLLAASNISGTIIYTTFADSTVPSAEELTWYVYGSRDPGLLVDGDNVVAVEVHQAALGSSDISFDLKLYQPAQ